MRLRNSIQKYDVVSHGHEYTDPVKPPEIIPTCPECYSGNTRRTDKSDIGAKADYICDDCGCRYNAQIQEDLTPVGRIICDIITILMILSMITMGASFIYGFVIGAGREDTILVPKCLCLMLLCPAILFELISVLADVHNKIQGVKNEKS